MRFEIRPLLLGARFTEVDFYHLIIDDLGQMNGGFVGAADIANHGFP
jgi:hypothetical protein